MSPTAIICMAGQITFAGERVRTLCRLEFVVFVVLAALMSGCQSNGGRSNSNEPGQLCLRDDCEQYQLVDLPQLENVHFTAEGRLFVTGQDNLYEISGSFAEGFEGKALLEGGGCSGMASTRDTLYALCQGSSAGLTDFSSIMVLDLSNPDAVPEAVFQLSNMTLPNGMGLGPDGNLYISDGPVSVTPKIVRVLVSADDPAILLGQETWLSLLGDWPNGVTWHQGVLYTTLFGAGLGTVVAVPLNPDGSAGERQTVYTRGRIMDDLIAYQDTLIVTDWLDSRLFQITLDGNLLAETPAFGFSQPSSVAVGQPPMFDPSQLLVTERYSGDGLWLLQAADAP